MLQGAEKLRDHYQGTVVYYEFYQLDGADHGAWNRYYEGKSHGELGVDFITNMLDLNAAANLHLSKRSFQIWRKPFYIRLDRRKLNFSGWNCWRLSSARGIRVSERTEEIGFHSTEKLTRRN